MPKIWCLASKEYVQNDVSSKDIAKLYFRSEKKRVDADYEYYSI